MSNCTSGCKTQDHASYADCLQSKNSSLKVMSPSGYYQAAARFQQENVEYRDARRNGIQPKSTKLEDVRSAVARSQKADKAVQDLG